MSTVRRFERHDFKPSDLAKPEKTAEGFWKLDGKVARTGIQIYRDGAGNVRRELRLEGDVKKSLDSFPLRPLTNRHPPGLVEPNNAQDYAVGAIGEATYQDGWVRAPITVWARDAIEAIERGRAELSVGYSCSLVMEPGVWEGQRYDARQTDIVVNHVALVDAARAGPDARLRLDANDAAVEGFFDSAEQMSQAGPTTRTQTTDEERKPMPYKIKLDGYEIEVSDANSASIIERTIAKVKADGEAAVARERERADGLDADVKRLTAEKTSLQAKHDTLEGAAKKDVKCDECMGTGKVDEKGCEMCGGKGEMKADALTFEARTASRARSDARAVAKGAPARAKLLAFVSKDISKHENLDGKSDLDVKKLWLEKKGVKLDGKDAGYISARFDAERDRVDAETPSEIEAARQTVVDGGETETGKGERNDGSSGRSLMQKRNRDAFVKRS